MDKIIAELRVWNPHHEWAEDDECALWNQISEIFQQAVENDRHAWKEEMWQEGMDALPYAEFPISSAEVPLDYREDMERAFENAVNRHREESYEEDEEDWEALDYECE